MRERGRICQVAKWMGLACCVLVAFGWCLSFFVNIRWTNRVRTAGVGLSYGAGGVHWRNTHGILFGGIATVTDPPGFSACAVTAGWDDRFAGLREFGLMPRLVQDFPQQVLVIPLWIPFIAMGIPTALLWRRDRRRPLAGHCVDCKYNLKGNVSGVCPECGTVVA